MNLKMERLPLKAERLKLEFESFIPRHTSYNRQHATFNALCLAVLRPRNRIQRHPKSHSLAPTTSIPPCRSRRPYTMRQSCPRQSRKSGLDQFRPADDHRKLSRISHNHRTHFSNQPEQRTCTANSNQSRKRQRAVFLSFQSEPEASAPVSALSGLMGQHIHCRG